MKSDSDALERLRKRRRLAGSTGLSSAAVKSFLLKGDAARTPAQAATPTHVLPENVRCICYPECDAPICLDVAFRRGEPLYPWNFRIASDGTHLSTSYVTGSNPVGSPELAVGKKIRHVYAPQGASIVLACLGRVLESGLPHVFNFGTEFAGKRRVRDGWMAPAGDGTAVCRLREGTDLTERISPAPV